MYKNDLRGACMPSMTSEAMDQCILDDIMMINDYGWILFSFYLQSINIIIFEYFVIHQQSDIYG